MDRGLWQKHVAKEIGCSKASLLNWEKGRAEPELRFLPAILRFLGYDPRPEQATLGGRIRAAREAAGLSKRELARKLGLDPGTLAAWERDEVRRPYPRIRRVFATYLDSSLEPGQPCISPFSTRRPRVLTYAMFTLPCRAVQDGAGGGGATVASREGSDE